jgi:uncharacterized membrane protein
MIMRYRVIALFSLAFSALAWFGLAAGAQEPSKDVNKDVKGLFLLTDYPAISVRPGATSSVTVRLQNYGLAPERLALTVAGVPSGWTATLMGGGQPIGAAMPATNANVPLELRLDVPKDAAVGTSNLTVTAQGATSNATLPLAVTIAKDLPAKLTLTPQLPELRGTSKSTFEYILSIRNDSGKKLTVGLSAQAPANFDATFTEQYGSQELSAVPVDPGQSKDVKLKVRPPNTVSAGSYKIAARISAEDAVATSELGLDVAGQPKLEVSGRQGILSASAEAGVESAVTVVVMNSGTTPAEEIELSSNPPQGWKITFEPKTIERLAPNETKEVQALITPPAKAVAGDYNTVMRASARGEAATANFRVQVSTSTMWGLVSIGLIGLALLVLLGAVAVFGRR